MNHSDLMQFKDEILKNLREMEKKIMTKVNKNQTDLSSDLITLTESINSIKATNDSMIDSMAEQKLNNDKIFTLEADLKKFNSTLTSQEKKINDSMIDISYIKEQYEKSLSDALIVPGIIGKNCKYKSFSDYIVSSNNEIAKLKSEKEYSKKESREAKQKLEQSIKSVSNLVDSFTNRSKLYTDSTKRAIIELIDTKISEIDTKNIELLAKICKIETEFEQKLKTLEDNLKELNTSKNEQFQKVEDKLLQINNQIENIDKSIKETKEELNNFKNKEKNDFYEIKNNFYNIMKSDNNNTENNNIDNTSNNINDIKEINNLNKPKNIKEMQNFSRNNNHYKTFNQSQLDFNKNISLNGKSNDDNNQIINKNNNNISQNITNSKINTEKSIIEKESLLVNAKIKNFEDIFNTEKPLIKFNNNNINNAILSNNHLQENITFSNPGFINFKSNNKKISAESFHEEDIISRNLEKHFDINNKPIEYNKRKFYNYPKNSSLKRDKEFFLSNKKSQKQKNISININENNNNIKLKGNKFPIIQEKAIKNIILTNEGIFNGKYNILNKGKSISPHKIKLIKNKNQNIMKYGIDKETGVGCNIVKLSIEDATITPYNTNGLLTMASKNILKRRLFKQEESMSFSFDNIFSNIFQYQENKHHKNRKKHLCSKTVQAFFGDDKTDFKDVVNSIDDNIKKEMAKTIQL